MHDLSLDHRPGAGRRLGVVRGQAEDLHGGEDGRHRVAQLVRQHRQELVLPPVGLPQLRQRAGALDFELSEVRVVGDDRHAAVYGSRGVEGGRYHEVHPARPQRQVGDLHLQINRFTRQDAGRHRFEDGEDSWTDNLRQRLSHHLLRLLVEAGRVVLVGPDDPEAAIVAGDEGGRRVDDDLEVPARPPHLRLGELALGDVLAGATQARRPAGGVPLDGNPGVKHAHGPIGKDDAVLLFEAATSSDARLRGVPDEGPIVGMNRGDENAVVDRAAGWATEDPIHPVGPAQRVRGPIFVQARLPAAHVRRGLGLGEHLLALPQGALGVLHLGDVGDQRREAPHAAAGVAIRDVGDRDIARVAEAEVDACFVRDLLAGERPRHVRLNRRPGGLSHDLSRMPAADRFGRATEPALVRPVDPYVAHLIVQIGEQRGDRVRNELKPL